MERPRLPLVVIETGIVTSLYLCRKMDHSTNGDEEGRRRKK